jgi:hypothetical protein
MSAILERKILASDNASMADDRTKTKKMNQLNYIEDRIREIQLDKD